MLRSARFFVSDSPRCRISSLLVLLLLPVAAHAQTTVPGGTISTDTTWTLAGSPYVVTGNVTVEGTDGADGVTTLTIEPGVQVRVQGLRFLYVGGSSAGTPGALVADGDAAGGPATITFTSDSGSPAAGDWYGIYFRAGADASSIVRNAVVEYGGASVYAGIYLYLVGGQTIPLQNVTVRDSGNHGIYQTNGATQLTDITILRSGNTGLYVYFSDTTISGLTVTDSGGYGVDFYTSQFSIDGCDLGPNTDHDIQIGATVDGTVQNCTSIESMYYAYDSTVTWSGNTFNNWGARTSRVGGGDLVGLIADNTINKVGGATVEVGFGTSTLDGAWTDAVGSPYVMVGNVTVAGSDGPDGLTTLTIAPGLELRFATNTRLYVGNPHGTAFGELVADGNATGGPATIAFTSDNPSPSPGDWIGIQFQSGAKGSSLLRNVLVEYAGRSNRAGLWVQPNATATITVEDVTIRDSSYYGVFQTYGTLVMNNVAILDSGFDGLHVSTASLDLDQLTIGANGGKGFSVYNSTFDLDGCSIGPSASYDVQIENSVTGTIQNCSSIASVFYNSTSSQVTWSGNTFHDWGAETSRVGAEDLGGLIADNTIHAVEGAVVEVATGTVRLDATWNDDVGAPYIVVGTVTVEGADGPDGVTTLTIEPGLELRFDNILNFTVGGTSTASPGALIADGDGTGGPATITFTSNKVAPSAGDWRTLYFRKGAHDSSILRNVLVQYGGGWIGAVYLNHEVGVSITLDNVSILDSAAAGLYQTPGDSVLSDVTITNTGGRGMHLGTGSVDMSQITVQGATDEGLYVYSMDFSIDGCVIDSNGGHDIQLNASSDGSVLNCSSIESFYYISSEPDVTWSGNTFNSWGARTSAAAADDIGVLCAGNTFHAVPGATLEFWSETIARDATWTPDPGPYVGLNASATTTIQGTDGPDLRTTLTLEPGVTIKWPSGGMAVGAATGDPGELIADGRLGGGAFSTVNFSSSRATPATGDWAGIDVRTTGRAEFHEAQILYADVAVDVTNGVLGPFERVTINRADIGLDLDTAVLEEPLTAATFRNCGTAVRSDRSGPVLRNCDLTGGSWGIENLTPATDCVDAESNWWNAVDGPWGDAPIEGCETETAAGAGSRISEGVLYANWLDAPSDDGDGIPCDDGDGFFDPCSAGNLVDCDDNCCIVANASQEDVDADGTGDACDENPVLRVSSDPLDGADFDVIQEAADAAFQSGTRIEIYPGLGPYHESALLDRLPPQVFSVAGLDTGSGPVVVDGGAGPAFNVLSKPVGVVPMRLHNLTLQGAEGVHALVDTDMSRLVFSTDSTALALDAGTHHLDDSAIAGAVGSGADIASGTTLDVRRTTMTGLTDAGLIVAGTADLENTLICEGVDGIRLTGSGSVTLDYTTIANHTGVGLDNTLGGTFTARQSIIHGSALGDILPADVGLSCPPVTWSDIGSPDCSASGDNLSADPLFDVDYRLQGASTCLDHGPDPAIYTGEPPTDLDFGPRLADHDGDGFAQTDPGAFERPGEIAAPGEVQNLRWELYFRLAWDPEPSAVEYHVYRGLLSTLSYASWGACEDPLDANRTDTQFDDTQEPDPGDGFFYLITADTGSDEGTLGLGTRAERSNFNECP